MYDNELFSQQYFHEAAQSRKESLIREIQTETIDQLLGYVTWRDTKTSIILFNKQADLSSVLAKLNETVRQHSNFKSGYQFDSAELKNNETIFAYKFTYPSDPEKEIYLTLLAFQINKITSI